MNTRHPTAGFARIAAPRQLGMSLIELMVAMLIGIILIFGATQVYVNSKHAYGVNEGVARMQETARYAMAVIEPDIRLANFWGLLKEPAAVVGSALQTAAPGAVAPGAAANICGNNFALDVVTNLQGDNNGAGGVFLSVGRQPGCNALLDVDTNVAWPTVPVTTADTLTVRRASAVAAAPTAGTIQVCSTRFGAILYSDGAACVVALPRRQSNNLVVNAYYIDRNSSQAAARPALRRKVLSTLGGVPVFRDQEIISGIEDMQIQFGIEPAPACPTCYTGVATRYVNPDFVLPPLAQIVSVRIWLLVYSDQPESGFTDNRIYQYGDRLQATGVTGDLNAAAGAGMAYQPSLNPDASFNGPQHRRRLLISRTIAIRNAAGT
jgi:type IV pilus assembly protein PilW